MNSKKKPWSNLISIFYDFKKVANMQFKTRFNQKIYPRKEGWKSSTIELLSDA